MKYIFPFILLCLFQFTSCQDKATTESNSEEENWVKPRVPEWHKNANMYEVNLRHYTPEGTLQAFKSHLPRLKEMGVDILWFMPIYPISETKRKGGLGSPYAISDYKAINPDFGTMDDFKEVLSAIHELGMKAIIDWVPNHTGWDHHWIKEHPEWYTKDKDGNITDPLHPDTGESWGWTDVADLDYSNSEMRKEMISDMTYWIDDIGIDGFRVDVAHNVPVDFWEECTDALYAVKPVFMLAEAEVPELLNSGSFVVDYAWEMHHLMNEIAKSQGVNKQANKLEQGNVVDHVQDEEHRKTALDIDAVLARKDSVYSGGYHLYFTSNHDENAWAGTEMDRFGPGHLTFAVLAATFDGMPLIYTGMESAFDKRMEFFEKDEVEWADFVYADFYKRLFTLKHENQALWNGEHGGKIQKIETGQDESVYAFVREKNGDRVVVILNLSSSPQSISLTGDHFAGAYTEIFSEKNIELSSGLEMDLEPWEYLVYRN